MRRDRRDRPRHVLHDATAVDRRVDGRQADGVGVAHAVRDRGGRDQALAGHAAGPQAVAADSLALGQRDARPSTGRDHRRHSPAVPRPSTTRS